jgi:hypothetical protein
LICILWYQTTVQNLITSTFISNSADGLEYPSTLSGEVLCDTLRLVWCVCVRPSLCPPPMVSIFSLQTVTTFEPIIWSHWNSNFICMLWYQTTVQNLKSVLKLYLETIGGGQRDGRTHTHHFSQTVPTLPFIRPFVRLRRHILHQHLFLIQPKNWIFIPRHVSHIFSHNFWTNYLITLKFELDLYFMVPNNSTKFDYINIYF